MRLIRNTILAFSLLPSAAFAGDGVSMSAEYVTEYVFRGVTLAGEAIQPSVELSFGPLTAGVWSSLAIGEEKEAFADEIDFYLQSGWDLSDAISGTLGVTLYHYPQLGGLFDVGDTADDAGTVEIYGGLDFDVPLSPSISVYYDIHRETATLEASTRYSVGVIDNVSLEGSLKAGLVEASEGVNYQYGQISAKVFYDFSDRAALFASANQGLSSEETFLDTNFDLSRPETLGDPKTSGSWLSVGLSSTF